MIKLPFADNVYLDSHAKSPKWDSQCETSFIEIFFKFLKVELGEKFSEYIFFIFSNNEKNVFPNSLKVNHPKKILIYLSDESCTVPWDINKSYIAIFKCYLPFEVQDSNIFPFPLGYVADVPHVKKIPIESRAIDVFFSGNLNACRVQLYQALHPFYRFFPKFHIYLSRALIYLLKKFGLLEKIRMSFGSIFGNSSCIVFTCNFKTGFNPIDYGASLDSSKIVLCPKGFVNTETFRHYEAMRAGAIVISEELPDTYFYRNAPFIIVKNWVEGIKKAKEILLDPQKQKDLSLKHLNHYEMVCSEKATAVYVSKILNRL